MESHGAVSGKGDLERQAESLRQGEDAAYAHARVPQWYWWGLGLLVGAEVFALSWGSVIAVCVTALAMLTLGRLLTAAVGRTSGIRIGKVFGGVATWVVLVWMAVLVALAISGHVVTASVHNLWPAVIAGVLGIAATAAFGYGFDRVRLQRLTVRS